VRRLKNQCHFIYGNKTTYSDTSFKNVLLLLQYFTAMAACKNPTLLAFCRHHGGVGCQIWKRQKPQTHLHILHKIQHSLRHLYYMIQITRNPHHRGETPCHSSLKPKYCTKQYNNNNNNNCRYHFTITAK